MRVRFFDPGKAYLAHKEEFDSEIQRVLTAGDLILRKDVENFETNLSSYLGVRYAVGLNSGTDALELALRALQIGRGDEVITVSNTFKATITSIMKVGAKPVLVDIGEDYLMDLDQLESRIGIKTRAIIPVHLSGDVCRMSLLTGMAGRNIDIIEDAAQAIGASSFDNKAGNWGTIGCFSFYPAKILGSFGDAGALVTREKNIADWVRNYRNHCKDIPGEDGMNSRLDNLQAAVLNVKLKYLDGYIKRRKVVADWYTLSFSGNPHIVCPTVRDVYQDYIIRIEARDALFDYLAKNEIETMKTPVLPHIELDLPFKLPKTEKYNKQFLRLPCNPELTDEQVHFVVEKVNEFYK